MLAEQKKNAARDNASYSPADITSIFDEIDTNGDGLITLKELMRGWC